jgi:hypothetical protein
MRSQVSTPMVIELDLRVVLVASSRTITQMHRVRCSSDASSSERTPPVFTPSSGRPRTLNVQAQQDQRDRYDISAEPPDRLGYHAERGQDARDGDSYCQQRVEDDDSQHDLIRVVRDQQRDIGGHVVATANDCHGRHPKRMHAAHLLQPTGPSRIHLVGIIRSSLDFWRRKRGEF